MKPPQFQPPATIAVRRSIARAALCVMGCFLLVAGSIGTWSATAEAQQRGSSGERRRAALEAQKGELDVEKLTQDQALRTFERRKAELEAQKIELEVKRLIEFNNLELQKAKLQVAKLIKDMRVPPWMTAIFGVIAGVLTGVLGTVGAIWTVRRELLGALDQSVHEKRLELYPKLVRATEPLALYFPPQGILDGAKCRAMGERLRTWYFEDGGILLSDKARDAYFKLARALTRASLAPKLDVPEFPQDAEKISAEKVKDYKNELVGELNADRVEDEWRFGRVDAESPTSAQRFRDFVFLQQLSSALRTELTVDLRSRRRPATKLA